MKRLGLLVLVILFLQLSGCAFNEKRVGKAAPIVTKNAPADSYSNGEVTISSYRQPTAVPFQQKRAGKAVQLLILRAQKQVEEREYVGALNSLERALKIEPRNPNLWHQLALVRVEQSQLLKASELAKKSNRYAAGDRSLKYDNWTLIALMNRKAGKYQAARAADKKAALYR